MLNIMLSILEQTAIYMPLILGAYCAFSLLKVPYLAIESAYVFGAIVASKVIFLNYPAIVVFVITCLTAMFAGATVGLITYVIKYYARISFLLSSIITIGLFHGVNQYVINGSHISMHMQNNILAMLPSIKGYPQLTTLLLFVCFITILFFYFTKSAIGLSCSIYGNNPDFFKHYGISENYIQLFGIVLSSLLGGISGFFSAYMNGFADINMGFGISLLCITVLILGRTCKNKKYSILIPLLGIVTYFVIQQLLLTINFDSRYFTMFSAIIVFGILFLTQKFAKGRKYELGL